MALGRFEISSPPRLPDGGGLRRFQAFLVRTWRGRILLGALGLYLLDLTGAPVPDVFGVLARIALFIYGAYGLYRLGRYAVRRLLWRIRTKLLVSYLFIAVVPVVLLVLLFLLAGLLFSGLVASHLVSSEVDRAARELRTVARASLWKLPPDDTAAATVIQERLGQARETHPDLSHALVRRGKLVAASGDAPRVLPPWWTGPGFAGVVQKGEGEEVVRAIWKEGEAFLILDAPLDAQLFKDLERRASIHVLTIGGRVESSEKGVHVKTIERGAAGQTADDGSSGMGYMATLERIDWETGKEQVDAITFKYRPFDLVRQLSPVGSINMADLLVKVLAVVAAIFLVVYFVALLLGLLLARSITRSVHALSRGTERLRQGDFTQPILIRSRDQLGELAESFNMMARGIQDLLREQGEKERLEEELRIARQIQMSLLPQSTVSLPGLRIAALCLPAAEVGGDYYDLLPLSATRMAVLIADVSGKGTSAALYMAELKGLVLSLSRIYESPAKLLGEANRILAATMDTRSFITMTYAVVDITARTMRYARAGHNPILHLETSTGRTKVLTPQGLGLGIDRGDRFEEVLEEAEVPLVSGDLFLFFTDGLSEAMNVRAELFGERRLRDILERSDSMGGEALKEQILSEIRTFVGEAAQHDDMTMVILKVA